MAVDPNGIRKQRGVIGDEWKLASRCAQQRADAGRNGSGGNNSCWEVLRIDGGWLVRDSKVSKHEAVDAPTFFLGEAEWLQLHKLAKAKKNRYLSDAARLAEASSTILLDLGQGYTLKLVPIGNSMFSCYVAERPGGGMSQSAAECAAFFEAIAADPNLTDDGIWRAVEPTG